MFADLCGRADRVWIAGVVLVDWELAVAGQKWDVTIGAIQRIRGVCGLVAIALMVAAGHYCWLVGVFGFGPGCGFF